MTHQQRIMGQVANVKRVKNDALAPRKHRALTRETGVCDLWESCGLHDVVTNVPIVTQTIVFFLK